MKELSSDTQCLIATISSFRLISRDKDPARINPVQDPVGVDLDLIIRVSDPAGVDLVQNPVEVDPV